MKRVCLLLSFAVLLVGGTSVKEAEAQTASLPHRLEGEEFSCDPASVRGSLDASGASGGKILRISGNGSATKAFTTSGAPTSLSLRMLAKRDSGGSPRLAVKLDGAVVKGVQAYNTSGNYQTFDVPLSGISPGTHTLELVGSNMGAGGGTRFINLDYVDVSEPGFSDTFDRDADSFVPPWTEASQAAPGRITTDNTHVRKGTHSAKFTVDDADNPGGWGARADLHTDLFKEGDDRWIGWSVLFPSDFLGQLSQNGWLMVAEDGYTGNYPATAFYFYGGPNGGSFTMDKRIGLSSTPTTIWSTTPTYGRWMDVVVHYKFSTDPSVGYVELWVNGQQQTFGDGTQRHYTNTRRTDAQFEGRLQHNSYREKGMAESVTLYQDEIKVGDSYDAVAP